ncbi:MAG: YidC/Oxa1 family membrane protein insertase [Firmicutes bacterium]|nr:YidC/Oxa1 family membrane protein insertase [Bacillota bacterium]
MIDSLGQVLIDFLDKIHGFTGSYGWAIIVFSAVIKAVLYYPTHAQYKSMKEMQKIQPELKLLQEKYKDNPQKMQTEQMELFKKHNVNPLGGCLPILIQMPILWAIFVAIKKMAANGSFNSETFLWIGGPLSKIYPQWFAGSLAERDIPLLLLYGFSMYLSQKLTVTDVSAEGTQQIMSVAMPVVFTFILNGFPSALILYWLMFNIFSIIQQYFVMKNNDQKPAAPESQDKSKDNADGEIYVVETDESDSDASRPERARSRSRKKKGGN